MSEFSEKLKTLQFSTKGFVTRDKRNYYDTDSVNETWGDDSKEKMLDQTQGLGYVKTDEQGRSWRKDRKNKEWVPVTEKEMDSVYLGGRTEQDG